MIQSEYQPQYQRMAARAHDIVTQAGNVWDEPRPGEFNLMEDAVYMPRTSFVKEIRSEAEFSAGLAPLIHMGEVAVRRQWLSSPPSYDWYEDGHGGGPSRMEARCLPKLLAAKENCSQLEGDGFVQVRTAAQIVGQLDGYLEPGETTAGFTSLAVSEVRRFGRDPHTAYYFALTCAIGNMAAPTRIVHTGGLDEDGGINTWKEMDAQMAIEQEAGWDALTGGKVFAPVWDGIIGDKAFILGQFTEFNFGDLTGMADVPLKSGLGASTWESLLARELDGKGDILLHKPQ